MASENIVELNDSNFDNEVSKISEPLLVDFWAPWCAPCRMLDPVVGEIARENAGKFAIAKVNVDESPGVSEKFGVRSIPTLLFFQGGRKTGSDRRRPRKGGNRSSAPGIGLVGSREPPRGGFLHPLRVKAESESLRLRLCCFIERCR